MITKLFYFDESKPPIKYRQNTSDESIIQTVLVEGKEYVFPRFKPRLVFDIGGNIGVLAVLLSNLYPEAVIHTFEPEENNFELLKENVKYYNNIVPMKVALGNKTETRKLYHSTDPNNLGGFSTFIEGDRHTTIDVIDVKKYCEKIGTPELIKIDVEGAEYEILSSIPHMEDVRWITGELHGIDEYKVLGLLQRDFRLNFSRRFEDKVWHFHGVSKLWADFGRDSTPQS